MKRIPIIHATGVLVALGTIALVLFWYLGHLPIAFHNHCLRSAIGKASYLEVTLVPKFSPSGELIEVKPATVIRDRPTIDSILSSFLLPWHVRATGRLHECDGHMIITIVMPDSKTYQIRFDHGKGIYPIDKGEESPGYTDLSESAITHLVEEFRSLGFSPQEIGLPRITNEQATSGVNEP